MPRRLSQNSANPGTHARARQGHRSLQRRKKDTMTGILQLLNSRSHHRGSHIKARRSSSRQLRIEALEQRAMLTTTATHFEVLVPTTAMPGVGFDITVRALDAVNQLVDNYS